MTPTELDRRIAMVGASTESEAEVAHKAVVECRIIAQRVLGHEAAELDAELFQFGIAFCKIAGALPSAPKAARKGKRK